MKKKVAGARSPKVGGAHRAAELKEKTIAELRAIAKKAGITLEATRKADIIEEIGKKVKPPKKAVKKPVKAKATKKLKKPAKAKPAPKVAGGRATPAMVTPPSKGFFTIFPGVSEGELPEVYEQDIITAIPLEPKKIFAYWEITGKALKKHKGTPCLRVYEGHSGLTETLKAETFFDIYVSTSTGSIYIDATPGRGFIIELGVVGPKGFSPVTRSKAVYTPLTVPSVKGRAEAVLPERYYEVAHAGWYED